MISKFMRSTGLNTYKLAMANRALKTIGDLYLLIFYRLADVSHKTEKIEIAIQ